MIIIETELNKLFAKRNELRIKQKENPSEELEKEIKVVQGQIEDSMIGRKIVLAFNFINMETAFQKFTRIINKWIGKSADYDKVYGAQCVDFARQYASDAGYPIGTFSGSAWNGWKTGSPFDKSWKRVRKTALNYPNPGDIVFFEPTPSNQYGHVAIANKGCSTSELSIIEQNAGSGNGDGKGNNAIRIRNTTYKGCPGWFSRV